MARRRPGETARMSAQLEDPDTEEPTCDRVAAILPVPEG
jgi:hypothetical protein